MNAEDIQRARWAMNRLVSANHDNVLFREVLGDVEIAFDALVLEVGELEAEVAYLTPRREEQDEEYEAASVVKPADVHQAITDEKPAPEYVSRESLFTEYRTIVGKSWGSAAGAEILSASTPRFAKGGGLAFLVYLLLCKATRAGFTCTAADILEEFTGCTEAQAEAEVNEIMAQEGY